MSIDILSSEFLSFYCSLPLAWISCLGLCDPGEFLDWFRGSLEISWLNGTRVLYFWPGLAIHMNFKLELWHPSNFVTWTGWSVCISGLVWVIYMNFKVGLWDPSDFLARIGWTFVFLAWIMWSIWISKWDCYIRLILWPELDDLFLCLVWFGWSIRISKWD